MDTQSTYVSQSTLYSAAGGGDDEGGEAKTAATAAASLQASRSFFIIDKSRMVGERDTVEDAKVVYLPESEFNKELYHSRCSCLVGVADVYRNMTGEFPQTLSMAGCYYACQLLEPNYFMFLLGRPLEPIERVRATLRHVSDIFHFYYHSPEAVMNKSRGDWLTFTANMTFIFSKIREYVFRDPHSIAFMFHTLPYNQKGHKQKRSRLFLQASHILRSCQEQEPIVGGCIMYNTEIVCNQLSPLLMEKIQVVGGKGIELNTKSILAENVAPETVWVLEVHLSPEEAEDLADIQRDLVSHRQAYEGMTPNPSLVDSAVSFLSRFQSGAGPTGISSSTSSSRGTPARSGWRVGRSSTRGHRSRPRVVEPNPKFDEDYYNLSVAFNSLTTQRANEAGGRLAAKHEDVTAACNANSSTITVLPRVTETPTTSPKVPRSGGGRGKTEPAGGGGGGRSRLSSDRKMPRLHGNSGKRDLTTRSYANPDTFPDEILPPAAPKTESGTAKLQDNSVPGVPPPASIPASLGIPIPTPGKSANEAHSPIPTGTAGSSSLEDERYATPSPNFSLVVPAAPGESGSKLPSPVQPTGFAADDSHSFQTADELSDKSHSPPPPPLPERLETDPDPSETDKKVLSIYDTITPPPQRRWTSQTSSQQQQQQRKFEESDDFVDSEIVDQLLSETRLMKQQEELSRPKRGRTGWEQDYHHQPPALPPRNRKIDDAPAPAPALPPHRLRSPSLVEVEQLVGNSGEFTVVELSPPAVPQRVLPPLNQQRGSDFEGSNVEFTPPPSPPPRTHSRKGDRSPEKMPQDSPDFIYGRPPTPPPRDHKTTEESEMITSEAITAAVERDGNASDLPERSGSSSPDYQHRGLTQSLDVGSSLEDGHVSSDMDTVRESVQVIEGRGWLGDTTTAAEKGGERDSASNKLAEEDTSQTRRSSSSVDPVKPEDRGTQLTGSGSLQDEFSSVKTLTSDEEDEDSGDGTTASASTTMLRYRHPSTSTPRENHTRTGPGLNDVGANALESLNLSAPPLGTPGGRGAPPSLSFNQVNTPEMTLQLSMAEKLRGTADEQGQRDGGEEGGKSQVLMVDLARIHQTLSRNLQVRQSTVFAISLLPNTYVCIENTHTPCSM
ncbi:hypothetical protein GBAR_LOCUS24413 [Geodia barretti]|uniref:Uncharacterized protein n=1 Tax=Geodia barretti TaxID=519541 RepID=A0AA35T9S1_GEOBA|nr:hypothetical protein GBAR_LOCUS24413 [Geodia barretti]